MAKHEDITPMIIVVSWHQARHRCRKLLHFGSCFSQKSTWWEKQSAVNGEMVEGKLWVCKEKYRSMGPFMAMY